MGAAVVGGHMPVVNIFYKIGQFLTHQPDYQVSVLSACVNSEQYSSTMKLLLEKEREIGNLRDCLV